MVSTTQLPLYVTSPKHSYIVRGDGQSVDVVHEGRIVWSAQLGRVYAAAVSSDGSRLVVLVSRGTIGAPQHPALLFFNLREKKPEGEKHYDDPTMIQHWGQYLGEVCFGMDTPMFGLQWMGPHKDLPPSALLVSYFDCERYVYPNADETWS